MRISVCMATYNGQRFLAEQIESILQEISSEDEVVIVDDASSDDTWLFLQTLQDARIRLFRNESNRGVNATFARAIELAQGEVIFMSDQDDRWQPGRVQLFVEALFESGALLASSNSRFMDAVGQPVAFASGRLSAADSGRHWSNILKIFLGTAGYFGCAMAFRRRLTEIALPIPDYVESHDLWLAMAANLAASNIHVESDTLIRRIHGNNASVIQRSLLPKLKSRWVFARSLMELRKRMANFTQMPCRDIG